MILTFKFRMYPTRQQESLVRESLETCRLLYNDLLADRMRNHTDFFAQNGTLTQIRRQDSYLKRVHSQVLQDVAFRLDKAVSSFFSGLSKYPKFKRRGRCRSLTYPQHGKHGGFRIVDGRLHLSMIGALRIKCHRKLEGIP